MLMYISKMPELLGKRCGTILDAIVCMQSNKPINCSFDLANARSPFELSVPLQAQQRYCVATSHASAR